MILTQIGLLDNCLINKTKIWKMDDDWEKYHADRTLRLKIFSEFILFCVRKIACKNVSYCYYQFPYKSVSEDCVGRWQCNAVSAGTLPFSGRNHQL